MTWFHQFPIPNLFIFFQIGTLISDSLKKKQAHFSDWSKSCDILEFGICEPNRRPQLLIDQQKVLQFRKLVNCNMNTTN